MLMLICIAVKILYVAGFMVSVCLTITSSKFDEEEVSRLSIEAALLETALRATFWPLYGAYRIWRNSHLKTNL